MLKQREQDCGPGDWCFPKGCDSGDGIRFGIHVLMPVRPEIQLAYFHFDREAEAFTSHTLAIRMDGDPEHRVGYEPRTWWWNGSLEAPTLRPSIKSRREVLPKDPVTGKYAEAVLHGFLTDGHWSLCGDDTLTREF